MSEDTQEKLFDNQEHPNKSGTNNERGSGIGLQLCQNLANMHHGSIKVDSEIGEGSTFTLTIPRADSSWSILCKPVSQSVDKVAAFFKRLWCKLAKEISYGLKLFNETLFVIIFDHLSQTIVVLNKF